eukprot:CAMPEP_0170427030 /NCGR_PEP_ID=MMETSP0117_2-20130122/38995_1 /TAXON_ID=400756 /ORGANISM="Durinskia baltica, Strain CSIRO CS-38" /LENGTH=58 /DNA_ID=CAMNT_0010686181 /DNA_START=128 /DNA_END=301 /DNA_ORIENTATION=-
MEPFNILLRARAVGGRPKRQIEPDAKIFLRNFEQRCEDVPHRGIQTRRPSETTMRRAT